MIFKCILKFIINTLNHLKILDSQKHGFPRVCIAQLEDVTDSLSSVLFCIIVLFFMAGSSKNFKKHQYATTKNTQKELNNITYILLDENTLVFYPLPLLF